MHTRRFRLIATGLVLVVAAPAFAQGNRTDHWVATWATAVVGRPQPGTAPQPPPPPPPPPAPLGPPHRPPPRQAPPVAGRAGRHRSRLSSSPIRHCGRSSAH